MISLFYGLNQQLRNHSPDWVQIPSTVHCAGTPEFPNPTPFLCTTYMTLHCTLHCMTFHSLPLDCIALHCIYCSAQNLYWFFSSLSLLKCNILGPIPHFQTHCCFHFGMNSSTIWPPVIVQSLLAPELTPGTWSNMVNLHTLAPSPSQCLKQPALSYTSYTFPVKIPSQSEPVRASKNLHNTVLLKMDSDVLDVLDMLDELVIDDWKGADSQHWRKEMSLIRGQAILFWVLYN